MSDETGITRYQAEVLNEIVLAAGDPGATMESIAEHMNQIFADAQERGGVRAQEIITSGWSYIEQLSVQQGHTLNIAAAAKELAEIATQQRDEILSALEDYDENHPELADFAATIREDAEEYAQEMIYDEVMNYAFEHQDEAFHDALESLCKIEMREQEKREKEREEQMLKWKQQAADELAKRATGAAS